MTTRSPFRVRLPSTARLALLSAGGAAIIVACATAAPPSPERIQAMQAAQLALQEIKTFINPGTMMKNEGMSHGVQMGRIVWVSGQVGLDNRGNIAGQGDLRAQAVQAFRNFDTVLDIARATPRDVVKLDIAIVGYKPEDLAMLRELAPRYFPSLEAPATTVVGVSSLSREGLLIAVEGVAMLRFVPADTTARRAGQ